MKHLNKLWEQFKSLILMPAAAIVLLTLFAKGVWLLVKYVWNLF
jgi:hypothetical protein